MDDAQRGSWKDAVSLLLAAVLIIGPAIPAALWFVRHVAPLFLDLDEPLVGWDHLIGMLLLAGLLGAMVAAGFLGSLVWMVVVRPFLSRAEAERWIFFGPRLRTTDRLYTRLLDALYGSPGRDA